MQVKLFITLFITFIDNFNMFVKYGALNSLFIVINAKTINNFAKNLVTYNNKVHKKIWL